MIIKLFYSSFNLTDSYIYGIIKIMENINFVIAKNLAALRKKNKLTQLELAEKLNYSDKAVSKWEQGESLPGIEVLYKLSKLYDVSLDYIVGDIKRDEKPDISMRKNAQHITIAFLSTLIVWFVATICYIAFNIFAHKNIWIFYCWCFPVSAIVLLVFNGIWGKRKYMFVLVSLLFWSILLCVYLQFIEYNIWIILLAGIPLQIATFLWSHLVKQK